VPFDVAFSLSAADRTAYVIAIGILHGNIFLLTPFPQLIF
jgi:hypothetical protein